MTIKEINDAYKEMTGKNYKGKFILEKDDREYSDEFIKMFALIEGEEIKLKELIGSYLDTDRWHFDYNLTIYYNCVPMWNSKEQKFKIESILYSDFEPDVFSCSKKDFAKLLKHIDVSKRAMYVDYYTKCINISNRNSWEY